MILDDLTGPLVDAITRYQQAVKYLDDEQAKVQYPEDYYWETENARIIETRHEVTEALYRFIQAVVTT